MDTLFISFNELTGTYKVNKNYLKLACHNFRKGKSKAWENKKDCIDKRKVIINLDTIPQRTRDKYNIPTSEQYRKQKTAELELAYEQQKAELEELNRQASIKKRLIEDDNRKSLVKAYKEDWFLYLKNYQHYYAHTPNRCEELAEQSAKDCAFWVRMLKITGSKEKSYRGKVAIGFEMYQDARKEIKLTANIKNIVHFRRLLKTLRELVLYNEDTAFIHKIAIKNTKLQNHRAVTGDYHKALAFSILTHEKIYPYRVVADLMNHHCLEDERPTITQSWVKHLMAKDKAFKTLVNQKRYGDKFTDDNIIPHAVRKLPTYPANVWMIDGTPTQFYCWNETRTKLMRLYLFTIIDVCSKKIVGYHTAYSEDRYMVMQSLKLAVMSEGHLPKEIVSDNFSANKTEEIIELKRQMSKLGVYWRHSKVGNAKDKSYVERFFGVFQTVECALYDDYIGEGITSKRLNARPNRDFLQRIAKEKETLTFKQMQVRVGKMISTYNQRLSETKKSPNEVYQTMPKPYAIEMNTVKTALMFWHKTKHTVKRGMVKIKVKKIEHTYEIYDHSDKIALQGVKVAVRYDPNDLDTIMLFNYKTDVAICECKKSLKVHIGVADRTAKDERNMLITAAKKKSFQKYLNDESAKIIDKGLLDIGKDEIAIAHPMILEKNNINQWEDKQFQQYAKQNNLTEADEEPQVYKPIKVIQKSNYITAEEQLLQAKEPLVKGSLKVVRKSNSL